MLNYSNNLPSSRKIVARYREMNNIAYIFPGQGAQFVGMACGSSIVSVDVGDVAEQLDGLGGSFIAKTREVEELAELLIKAVNYGKTNGHQHIVDMCLSNEQIAEKLIEIYTSVVRKG